MLRRKLFTDRAHNHNKRGIMTKYIQQGSRQYGILDDDHHLDAMRFDRNGDKVVNKGTYYCVEALDRLGEALASEDLDDKFIIIHLWTKEEPERGLRQAVAGAKIFDREEIFGG